MMGFAVAFSGLAVLATTVTVDPDKVKAEISPTLYGTGMEDVNHEIYGGLDAQRLFGESFEEALPTGQDIRQKHGVSSSWRKAESLDGADFIRDQKVFHWGTASQRLLPGGGVAAISNHGLRDWGVPCTAGRKMVGYVWTRGKVDRLEVALQSEYGDRTYATAVLATTADELWHKAEFELTPSATDAHGRFLLRASGRGDVALDDVYLADAPTNEFGKLGCREDIVAGFREEGVTFLRWGGTMANAREYRLKAMEGKGERRPYEAFWYRKGSGGFGPYEFVRMAAAMKLPAAFSISAYEETDAAVRLAEELKAVDVPLYVEIGNEELTGWGENREDRRDLVGVTNYVTSARRLVAAMRAANPRLQFVAAGMWTGPGGMKDLPVMEAAFRGLDGVVEWWDVHTTIVEPVAARRNALLAKRVMELFREWNPKTTMRVAVFEENGNNHGLDRALAHAVMLETAREMGGDCLTSCPANALQPYLHNDNWWDQGSVFFTPTQVWLQPCGYAQQMAARFHRELLVASQSDDADVSLSATRARDGKSVVLHLVNSAWTEKPVRLAGLDGWTVSKVLSLSGPSVRADNPPDNPRRISPKDVTEAFRQASRLEPYSYAVVELVPARR